MSYPSPIVQAKIVVISRSGRLDRYTVQIECPYCVYRRKPTIHTHGFALEQVGEGNHRHRVAHCGDNKIKDGTDPRGGYYIAIPETTPLWWIDGRRSKQVGTVADLVEKCRSVVKSVVK